MDGFRTVILGVTAFLLPSLTVLVYGGSPKLEFPDGNRVNLGAHPIRESKSKAVRLKNTGDSLLKFGRIFKSCGCTQVKLSKKVLTPGESGVVSISFIPYSLKGKYQKIISIATNDPKQRFAVISVSGESVPLVEVIPDNRFYPRYLPIGKTWEQVFSLRVLQRQVKFAPPRLSCNYPVTLEKLSEKELLKNGKPQRLIHYLLKITPGTGGKDLNCKIDFPVLEPQGWKNVVVTAKGRVGLRLYVFPDRIKVANKNNSDKVKTEFQLRLLGEAGKEFDTSRLVVTQVPGLSLTFKKQKGIVLPVIAELDRDFLMALSKKKKITIEFSYPESNKASLIFTK